jgi:hypothetical protein
MTITFTHCLSGEKAGVPLVRPPAPRRRNGRPRFCGMTGMALSGVLFSIPLSAFQIRFHYFRPPLDTAAI